MQTNNRSQIYHLLIFTLRHLDSSKNFLKKGLLYIVNFDFITPLLGVILINFIRSVVKRRTSLKQFSFYACILSLPEEGHRGLPKYAAGLNKSENTTVGMLCFCVDWIVDGEDSYSIFFFCWLWRRAVWLMCSIV